MHSSILKITKANNERGHPATAMSTRFRLPLLWVTRCCFNYLRLKPRFCTSMKSWGCTFLGAFLDFDHCVCLTVSPLGSTSFQVVTGLRAFPLRRELRFISPCLHSLRRRTSLPKASSSAWNGTHLASNTTRPSKNYHAQTQKSSTQPWHF